MQLTKSVFKQMIKECLVEILAEGLDVSQDTLVESRQTRRRKPARKQYDDYFEDNKQKSKQSIFSEQPRRNLYPATDSPVSARQENKYLKEQIQNTLTNDSTLASMLADTAQTTLIEQQTNGGAYADGAALAMNKVDNPEELFGQMAGKWSALAGL